MERVLIPKSECYQSILSPLWLANTQNIVLVKSDGKEFYVSGIYFTPGDKEAYAVEHYLPGRVGVLDSFNKGPVSINSDDNLYLEK